LKKYGVEDADEIKEYKEYIVELKKCLDTPTGVINLDLFRKIGGLKLCKGDSSKCMNRVYVKRTSEDLEPTFR
jgi:hypothetical protein|tara:strand:+ start:236 stop:454 length:219 start_codon:yes stop_codon:yes gene_type:complete